MRGESDSDAHPIPPIPPPMKVEEARERFEAYLSERRLTVDQLDAENALVAMVGFYLDVRADDVDMDAGGDMLLFDWGTYEWDDGARFQYCVTRQFIVPEGDGSGDAGGGEGAETGAGAGVGAGACWHLALTLYFEADGRTLALDAGECACGSFSDLDVFMTFVDGAAATRHARRRNPTGIRLDLQEVVD